MCWYLFWKIMKAYKTASHSVRNVENNEASMCSIFHLYFSSSMVLVHGRYRYIVGCDIMYSGRVDLGTYWDDCSHVYYVYWRREEHQVPYTRHKARTGLYSIVLLAEFYTLLSSSRRSVTLLCDEFARLTNRQPVLR